MALVQLQTTDDNGNKEAASICDDLFVSYIPDCESAICVWQYWTLILSY